MCYHGYCLIQTKNGIGFSHLITPSDVPIKFDTVL